MQRWISASVVVVTLTVVAAGTGAAETAELLRTIKAVGPEGEGHDAAVVAARALAQAEAEALPAILAALEDANPLAANWLRGAFEGIADRSLRQGADFPRLKLEAHVRDRSRAARSRRLAYEWLVKADPGAADRIIPDMLDDPSAEMRRDAVARVVGAARQLAMGGRKIDAARGYRDALSAAADGDQVREIAAALQELGERVDLVDHFGLITKWRVIGPFDNSGRAGWKAVYPPESEVAFDAEYEGKLGRVRWEPLQMKTREGELNIEVVGLFDIAKLTQLHPDAVSYAATEFHSDRDRDVEFRISTPNAWKLWVNARLAFGQEEYHRGRRFDQYIVRGKLTQGRNVLLLKVCQNEQKEDWAQVCAFQFRVCDLAGKALRSSDTRTAAR